MTLVLNEPVPETICTAVPFNVKFPAVVAPTEISITPLFVILPETVSVLPVVPLNTFTIPPELTIKFPLTEKEVGEEP